MTKRRDRPGMTWEQMQRATLAEDRREYRESTVGERVEDVLRLSYFMGEIAAAGERRRSAAR